MLGDFTYHNPTRLHFGPHAMEALAEELAHYGPSVLLCYGQGSVKAHGVYDEVMAVLEAGGKRVCEDGGVTPNPTTDKLEEGIALARNHTADLILAVGGGSVIDYAKAVSVSANLDGDPWDEYYLERAPVTCKTVPVGSVLTMVGTGSEMNATAVISNPAERRKMGRNFGDAGYPAFAILNPLYTYSLPKHQMVAGIFDIMSHVLEQYLSGSDDCTSDYLAEGLMRSVVASSRVAIADPEDYEARSNLMWCATWALNSLLSAGKPTDWQVHQIGHAISAFTGATHGDTLAVVTLPYLRAIMGAGEERLARFARSVWGVDDEGLSTAELAEAGIRALEGWMGELGLPLCAAELGVTEDNVEAIAATVNLKDGGYRPLSTDDILAVLRSSMERLS